jgi:hypothetical protein
MVVMEISSALLGFALTVSCNAGTFNTIAFEKCVFHAVDADGGSHLPTTKDLLEEILTTNIGNQPWTVSAVQSNLSTRLEYGPLAFRFRLEEWCSVNILIQLHSRTFRSLYSTFGRRAYRLGNLFLLILTQEYYESRYELVGIKFGAGDVVSEESDGFLYPDLFLSFWDKVKYTFQESFSFCGRCSIEHMLTKYSDPQPTSLLDMKQFSQKLRNIFSKRVLYAVSTSFAYRRELYWRFSCRRWSDSEEVGCDPRRIFIHHLTHKLNLTAEYLPWHRAAVSSKKGPATHGIVTMDFIAWTPTEASSYLNWYLRDRVKFRFLYCREWDDRESFSFFFWTKPFDGWGWALLALSMLGLTLVLKGNWLDVFGALLVRQSASSLDSHKTLILLVAAAIVITCGYESIISSELIVPPPVLVARSLRDLLGSGYRLGNLRFPVSVVLIKITNSGDFEIENILPWSKTKP